MSHTPYESGHTYDAAILQHVAIRKRNAALFAVADNLMPFNGRGPNRRCVQIERAAIACSPRAVFDVLQSVSEQPCPRLAN